MSTLQTKTRSKSGRRRTVSAFSTITVTLLIVALALLMPTQAQAQSQSLCGDTVTVARGDTLRGIAQRCGVSFSALIEANPQIVNRNLIYVGQQINIPQDGLPEQPGETTISISPVSGPVGTRVDVAATGFPADSEIVFGIGPQGLTVETNRVVTGPEGQSETSLVVPDGVEVGQTLVVVAFVTQEDGVVEATANFNVTSGDTQPAVPVQIEPTSGPPGANVQVTASGLPANAIIEMGAGQINTEYDIIAQAQSDAQGNLNRSVRIPELANAGEEWVIAVTPSGSPADYISNQFTVTEPSDDDENQGLFTRTNIYLIALEDEGRSGTQIGCGDSVVPVEVEIEPTLAVLTAAMNSLLDLDERFYGESGLYNALYRSDLSVDSISLVNGVATINLSGEVSLGGVCDVPRFEAQLRQTALQYYTVDSVEITINGEPLAQVVQ
ncbi:LysM peptidoglycan-binding domain-containing protein [bacterium]|nr:LysM peptidoglycan-binding domain-containing protein [bacterium]